MNYKQIHTIISSLALTYQLADYCFDNECIYNPGDLAALLTEILSATLPETGIAVTEQISGDGTQYIATLSDGRNTMQIATDVHTDWLADTFHGDLATVPVFFDVGKRYYHIHPYAGLTGQESWYFCGTEEHLRQARMEGLPLQLPEEDMDWNCSPDEWWKSILPPDSPLLAAITG